MKSILIILATLTAFAAHAVKVPEIAVSGLGKYAGQFVSLYYVSGKPASFGTSGQDLDINKVLAGPVTQKIGSGQVSFNSREVKRSGFAAFNYVVAVVHDQSEHFITNLRLVNGAVTRNPVSTSGKAVSDNNTNRKFAAKKFKSSLKLKNNAKISF